MNHEQKWKRIEAIEAELIELGKRQIELRNEHTRLLMTRATDETKYLWPWRKRTVQPT